VPVTMITGWSPSAALAPAVSCARTGLDRLAKAIAAQAQVE